MELWHTFVDIVLLQLLGALIQKLDRRSGGLF